MVHERNEDAKKTEKDEQRTPISLFAILDKRFRFAIDLCCTRENCLCHAGIFRGTTDSLVVDWKRCTELSAVGLEDNLISYCNPPYSKGKIDKFVKKAYEESLKGAVVVMLLPADISTRWWNYCMFASEWIRIKGRVKFNHADGTPIKGSPKFGSMVVVFDKATREKNGHLVVSEMGWKE